MKTLDDEYEKNIGQFHGSESDLDDIDSAKGFADLSRRWASEDYGTSVDGVEYSSKHYATDSKESSEVSLEAAEISVNASNVATDGATNAKQSEDNAKVSEDNAKQSEDNIYALVDGIDDVVDAAIESVVNEGNTQVVRVTDEGGDQVGIITAAGQVERSLIIEEGNQQITLVVSEGDTQEARLSQHSDALLDGLSSEGDAQVEKIEGVGDVISQDIIRNGDIQVLRIRNEGDIQADRAEGEADRAEAEADRAENEADRAEAAAIDLDNAPRYHGYFSPNVGYPPPPEQRIPYQWFCTEDGTAGGIAWSEGDMLYYAPHPTNPDGEMGQYFRVAGELAAGGDPQPIEIPDDLIMQVDKKIYFRDAGGRLVQALSLDGNDDLLLGEMTPNLENGEGAKAINALGLAATEIYHIEEQDESGTPTVYHILLSEKNGATLAMFEDHVNDPDNPHNIDYTQTGAAAAQHEHPWEEVTEKPAQATRWPAAAEVTAGEFIEGVTIPGSQVNGEVDNATTATNQSGGTVNATTGAFSAEVTIQEPQQTNNPASKGYVDGEGAFSGKKTFENGLDVVGDPETWGCLSILYGSSEADGIQAFKGEQSHWGLGAAIAQEQINDIVLANYLGNASIVIGTQIVRINGELNIPALPGTNYSHDVTFNMNHSDGAGSSKAGIDYGGDTPEARRLRFLNLDDFSMKATVNLNDSGAPVLDSDLTNKGYVDTQDASLEERIAALENSPAGQIAIGGCYLSMTADNPVDVLGYGEWALITGDATLSFGDGTARDGAVIGGNSHTLTAAQIPAHTHDSGTLAGASHTHTMAHNHSYTWHATANAGSTSGGATRAQGNHITGTTGGSSAPNTGGAGVGISGSTGSVGSGEAHNIQSARILINVWRRTA
ncbi:hypothetical protein VCHA52P454_10715 [Vibrio chagasii]|nr:hypothetical protein VCHA52P454_10715 [Vibrio chagasii]